MKLQVPRWYGGRVPAGTAWYAARFCRGRVGMPRASAAAEWVRCAHLLQQSADEPKVPLLLRADSHLHWSCTCSGRPRVPVSIGDPSQAKMEPHVRYRWMLVSIMEMRLCDTCKNSGSLHGL